MAALPPLTMGSPDYRLVITKNDHQITIQIDRNLKVRDLILNLIHAIHTRNELHPGKEINITPMCTRLLASKPTSKPPIFYLDPEAGLEAYDLPGCTSIRLLTNTITSLFPTAIVNILGAELVDQLKRDLQQADSIVDQLVRKRIISESIRDLNVLKNSLDLTSTERIAPRLNELSSDGRDKMGIQYLNTLNQTIALLSNSLQYYISRWSERERVLQILREHADLKSIYDPLANHTLDYMMERAPCTLVRRAPIPTLIDEETPEDRPSAAGA